MLRAGEAYIERKELFKVVVIDQANKELLITLANPLGVVPSPMSRILFFWCSFISGSDLGLTYFAVLDLHLNQNPLFGHGTDCVQR